MFDPFTGLVRESELDEGEAFAFDHRNETSRASMPAYIAFQLRQDRRRPGQQASPVALVTRQLNEKPFWRRLTPKPVR